MTDYRLYFLDAGDHIVSATVISAASDRDAIRLAKRTAHDARVELWSGARQVAALDHARALRLGSKTVAGASALKASAD